MTIYAFLAISGNWAVPDRICLQIQTTPLSSLRDDKGVSGGEKWNLP